MKKEFPHIDTRIYDLDGTLYDLLAYASPQMSKRMNEFIAREFSLSPVEANNMRQDLYERHGTTLVGLVKEHKVDAGAYLKYAHDFDVTPIALDDGLREKLAHVQERQIIFTSAPLDYAERLTQHWGIRHYFDAIHAIEDANYAAKSELATYQAFLARFSIDPTRAMMHEDSIVNLIPAHTLGMTNVLIHGANTLSEQLPHVHHATSRLVDWMHQSVPVPAGQVARLRAAPKRAL